jgi:hypothetical protein
MFAIGDCPDDLEKVSSVKCQAVTWREDLVMVLLMCA